MQRPAADLRCQCILPAPPLIWVCGWQDATMKECGLHSGNIKSIIGGDGALGEGPRDLWPHSQHVQVCLCDLFCSTGFLCKVCKASGSCLLCMAILVWCKASRPEVIPTRSIHGCSLLSLHDRPGMVGSLLEPCPAGIMSGNHS